VVNLLDGTTQEGGQMEDLRIDARTEQRLRVTVDPELCNGCRTCELACSFHHSGLTSPELSSMKVRRSNRTAAITWEVLPTCDLCADEAQPLCGKYCSCTAIRIAVCS
jgi:carbon-monoxide dehydrogenase iron sulfur subunit